MTPLSTIMFRGLQPLPFISTARPARLAGMSPARKVAAASFNEIATVRIELRDSDPLIWREVDVPTSVTLKVLHDIVQAVMNWFDDHLWEFTIGERTYGLPTDEDWETAPHFEAIKVRLRDVLQPETTIIDYVYDFGDGWEHRLIVTDVRAGDPAVAYPRYLGGERNAPIQDCGGLPGFYAMLEALADPEHPDHAEVTDWLDDYDPQVIDELPIGYALSRIARRRNAARVRISKQSRAGPAA